MTATSCKEIAEDLLARCLAGHAPDVLPRALAEDACGQALFGIFVEGLADRFEPALCEVYARLFAQAVAQMPAARSCTCGSALSHAIITDRKLVPEATRRKLGILIEKYFV